MVLDRSIRLACRNTKSKFLLAWERITARRRFFVPLTRLRECACSGSFAPSRTIAPAKQKGKRRNIVCSGKPRKRIGKNRIVGRDGRWAGSRGTDQKPARNLLSGRGRPPRLAQPCTLVPARTALAIARRLETRSATFVDKRNDVRLGSLKFAALNCASAGALLRPRQPAC